MGGPVKAAPGRPVLTVVPPWTEPDHRHGISWRLFQVRQAAGTVRWRILTAVAAAVATVVPRVRGEAWREGFDVALGRRSAVTWRQALDSWRLGNEVAHEIVYRRHGQRWDGHRFSLCCPFLVPDPPALAAVAADVAAEALEYSGAARAEAEWRQQSTAAATAGARWRTVSGALRAAGPDSAADLAGCGGRIRSATRRAVAAAAVMSTAAVAADNHRVAGLAPLVATRRIVVVEGRHVATPGHPGRPRSDRSRPAGRHACPRWRSRAARWIRDAIRWHERGAHRADRWPLRAAA
jgi:hypothetical protein